MKGLCLFRLYILPCGTRDMKCNADISLKKSLTIILFAYVMLDLVKGRRDSSSGGDGV